MSHRHLLHCLVEVELIHMFLVSGFQSHMLLQTTLLTLSGTTFWKLNECDQNNIFKLSQHLHIFITWVTIDEADTTYVSGSNDKNITKLQIISYHLRLTETLCMQTFLINKCVFFCILLQIWWKFFELSSSQTCSTEYKFHSKLQWKRP